ncbi:hypothetical protein ZHAS_00005658 [Anopheles sinensis]|uniref:Uncharacterized protein n=1 Tax=Anopheles sinensis TaxID=74873 RepID=A0A084VK17_ANOSI|nr:hypothetical protein ZHAS_00005658 [Anopheles sinensis]
MVSPPEADSSGCGQESCLCPGLECTEWEWEGREGASGERSLWGRGTIFENGSKINEIPATLIINLILIRPTCPFHSFVRSYRAPPGTVSVMKRIPGARNDDDDDDEDDDTEDLSRRGSAELNSLLQSCRPAYELQHMYGCW